MFSGSNDMTVRVWDAATGAELRRLQGHEHTVNSLAFSPDGRWMVSGSWDKTVRVWDAATGVELRRLEGIYDKVLGDAGTKLFTGHATLEDALSAVPSSS